MLFPAEQGLKPDTMKAPNYINTALNAISSRTRIETTVAYASQHPKNRLSMLFPAEQGLKPS